MCCATPRAARRNAGWRSGPEASPEPRPCACSPPGPIIRAPSSSTLTTGGSRRAADARENRPLPLAFPMHVPQQCADGRGARGPKKPVGGSTMRKTTLLGVAAVALLAGAASAQEYPTGPITIVVPFAAGGPTDTVTRLIAEPMSEALGQQIVVQNVGGAGGTLGATQVAHAPADGYTLLLHHIGMSTAPSLYAEPRLRPGRELRADRARHRRADDHHRAQGLRADDAGGAGRLREGERRHRHLRQRRHRRGLASLRPAVHGRRSAPSSPRCPTRAPARR